MAFFLFFLEDKKVLAFPNSVSCIIGRHSQRDCENHATTLRNKDTNSIYPYKRRAHGNKSSLKGHCWFGDPPKQTILPDDIILSVQDEGSSAGFATGHFKPEDDTTKDRQMAKRNGDEDIVDKSGRRGRERGRREWTEEIGRKKEENAEQNKRE